MVIGCVLGAFAAFGLMFSMGFRLDGRISLTGSLWRRLVGPAKVVVPIPPPLDSPGCRPGDRPPPLPSDGWLEGNALKWDDLIGQVVVIDAWASWCPYCHVLAPDLDAVCRRYEVKGAITIRVTSDSRGEAEEFCKRHGLSGHVVCDAEAFLRSWLDDHYPAFVVVGRDGKVLWNDGAARFGNGTYQLVDTLSHVLEHATSDLPITFAIELPKALRD
jgi:thiol-disulfide isomerase/thioredoxin